MYRIKCLKKLLMHEYPLICLHAFVYCYVHLRIFVYFCMLALNVLQLSMHQLNKIVVPGIKSEWKNVAYSMGYKVHDVKAIEKDCHYVSKECCQCLLSKWLTASHHPTWSKLLEYIKEVEELVAPAEEIQTLITGS